MSDEYREQVSALVDGELTQRERRELLDRLERDAALRARWGRYHVIGDALRNDLPVALDHRLVERVSAALEREPTVLAPPPRRWLPERALGGRAAAVAVAASVLGVAILVGSSLGPSDESGPTVASTTSTENSAVREPVVVAEVPSRDRGRAMVDSRLNSYVVNHNEYAASNGMQGVLPYMRIVGPDTSERVAYDGR